MKQLRSWLVCTLLVAAPAAAQEDARAAVAPERTYVLHLTDGGVLRARARTVDGRWEIQKGIDWVTLPAGAVERAVPERDLVRRAKTLERELRGLDPVRRVAFAAWLLDQGLRAEALVQLDRVLAADPEHEAARALLGRGEIPVQLPSVDAPAGVAALVAVGARSGPVGRELAAQRLMAAPEIPGLRECLLGELVASSPKRRSFATLALRRVMPGQEVRPLLSRAVLDASADVRRGASLALGAVDDPAVIVPVVRVLGSQNPRVRQNAINALGTMRYAAAVEPLYTHLVNLQRGGAAARPPRSNVFVGRQLAYVQDFDVEVAQGQAIADPVINVVTEGAVLEAAVTGVYHYVVQNERAAVRRALTTLTGAAPGNTTAAWKKWWQEHGDEWQARVSPLGPRSSPSRREE